jgi:branched-chain amino acid transport system substrate-binding protein
MSGGGMVGSQYAALKTQLGRFSMASSALRPMFRNWRPTFRSLSKYQVRVAAEKIDQLGFYLPPFAYAAMQILEKAVWTKQGCCLSPYDGV